MSGGFGGDVVLSRSDCMVSVIVSVGSFSSSDEVSSSDEQDEVSFSDEVPSFSSS